MREKEFDFPKETREFPLVKKGTYRCTVYDIDDTPSRAEGNPLLTFQYKIVEGEFQGQILFDRYSLLPQSMWKLQQTLLTFGIDARGKTKVDLDALIGAECQVTVIHQNYEGEAQPRVRKVVGLDTIKSKPVKEVKKERVVKKVEPEKKVVKEEENKEEEEGRPGW